MYDIMDTMIEIVKTPEFHTWYSELSYKEKLKVDSRLERIEVFHHFGDFKYLSDGVAELRWKNGWRVYFARYSIDKILILLGGTKNGQKKDIEKAKNLLQRYANNIN